MYLLQLLGQTPPTGGGTQLSESQVWAVLGLIVMAGLYVTVVRPMMRKRDPLDRPTGMQGLSQQRGVERQMQNLIVELSEMARQITGQIDTRAAKLEHLIREADAKIAELKSAGDRNEPSNAASAALQSLMAASSTYQGNQAGSSVSEDPDPRHTEIYALADQGRDAYEIAAQLGRPRGEVELILALRSK